MLALAIIRRRRFVISALGVLGLVALSAHGAAAQTPQGATSPGEVAVAAAFYGPPDVNRQPECIDLNLPCSASGKTIGDPGWAIIGSRNLTDRFAITGEVGLFHNLWDSETSIHSRQREDNLVHFALIGPRIESPFMQQRGRTPSEARVFGQVLVGVAGGDVVVGGVAIQPGVGGDIRFPSGVMLRLQVDYCFVPHETNGRSISGARMLVAIGFGVGSRLW